MEHTTLLLNLANLAFIGLLPVLFFRAGRLTRMWLVTATPFVLAGATLIAAHQGWIATWEGSKPAGVLLVSLGVLLNVVSIATIGLTIGVHRLPLALWHQSDDAPVEIVTWGPYSAVRHPFYTSFLAALAGAVCAAPHLVTCALLVCAFGVLNFTAAREERRLAASRFGDQYRSYMATTGRFLPRRSGA